MVLTDAIAAPFPRPAWIQAAALAGPGRTTLHFCPLNTPGLANSEVSKFHDSFAPDRDAHTESLGMSVFRECRQLSTILERRFAWGSAEWGRLCFAQAGIVGPGRPTDTPGILSHGQPGPTRREKYLPPRVRNQELRKFNPSLNGREGSIGHGSGLSKPTFFVRY
jgi:hypothetical protein